MKKVLIIDDEIDLCFIIARFLSKKDFEVHTSHTLADGLFKLRTLNAYALLLDNNLPDGLGWSHVQQIHKDYPEMKITLISAYLSNDNFTDRMEDYIKILEKPISISELIRYL